VIVDELDDIEALLSTKSAKEQDTNRVNDEIQELLSTASTKELSLAEKFRSMGGSQVGKIAGNLCYLRQGAPTWCQGSPTWCPRACSKKKIDMISAFA